MNIFAFSPKYSSYIPDYTPIIASELGQAEYRAFQIRLFEKGQRPQRAVFFLPITAGIASCAP